MDLPNGVVLETATATATITDYRLTVNIRSAQATVREGTDATFIVTLSDSGRAPVVVDYTIGGDVTSGTDYHGADEHQADHRRRHDEQYRYD